ncbi:chitobiase [Chitinispirillum alkaliphilum]|nr:chitobiase [Chitinispirillum alkaliphilum]
MSTSQILINQVGYNISEIKKAVLQTSNPIKTPVKFHLIYNSGQEIQEFQSNQSSPVEGWSGRYFSVLDFSSFNHKGRFRIKAQFGDETVVSDMFYIEDNLLFNSLAAPVLGFFYGMRSYIDDRFVSFIDKPEKIKDVSGGWDDASADTGKYLSHLSYANYFNPQHSPMVVWSILKSLSVNCLGFLGLEKEMQEEAIWGADFLVRMFDRDGFFYTNVFDRWGMDDKRVICAYKYRSGEKNERYQAAYREGAGMSIAALARMARYNYSGTYCAAVYLDTAETAFAHLEENNLKYLENGRENIIDYYCALIASTELFKTTQNQKYSDAAQKYAQKLLSLQTPQGWFRSEENSERPFFHGVDEGLVIIALCEFIECFGTEEQYCEAVAKSAEFYIDITNKDPNPFSYVKQYRSAFKDDKLLPPETAFFMPHDNETGYWWQGENARIASLSSALVLAYKLLPTRLEKSVEDIRQISISQIDWILGKNPFGICMVCGSGYHDYPDLQAAAGKFTRTNVVGGICNGITSREGQESDIQWMEDDHADYSVGINWRWAEQWLPHNTWFLLSISAHDSIL